MSKFIFSFFVLMATNAHATGCVDFSGVYFEGGSGPWSASCTVIEQTGCTISKETLYMGLFPSATVEFITDGELRRYSIEPSMQKSLSYDSSGNMVFLGIDDSGLRIEGTYEQISNGDIQSTSKRIQSNQTEISHGLFQAKASLKECLEAMK